MEQALLITNLNARTVSQRVKEVIVKALSADLKLEVEDTKARNHATELARDAADRGFDLVISFGGDGTMNEVANGLVGTETAMAVLPGGLANVLCRVIGVPTDIVEATGYLMNRVRNASRRRINVGKIEDRHFVLSCGIGLDAATVKRVEARPDLKRKYKDWFFLYSAFQTAFLDYRGREPYVRLKAGDVEEDVVLAVISNTREFTYFKNWPVVVTPRASISGGLDVLAMTHFRMSYIPRLTSALLRTGSHLKNKRVRYVEDVPMVSAISAAEPFPVQLDGEYVGERESVRVDLVESGLSLID